MRSSRPSPSSGARSGRPTCCRPPAGRAGEDRPRAHAPARAGRADALLRGAATIGGVPSLCLVAVRRKVGVGGGAAGRCRDAVAEGTPHVITVGPRHRRVPARRLDRPALHLRQRRRLGDRDEQPVDRRRTRRSRPSARRGPGLGDALHPLHRAARRSRSRAADACPAQLEPLPTDALAARQPRGADRRRPALPEGARGRPSRARARPRDTCPCSAAVTERSIEVSLHLVPRSAGEGRLLLGMEDGSCGSSTAA